MKAVACTQLQSLRTEVDFNFTAMNEDELFSEMLFERRIAELGLGTNNERKYLPGPDLIGQGRIRYALFGIAK